MKRPERLATGDVSNALSVWAEPGQTIPFRSSESVVRLHVLSDLHLECAPFDLPPVDADALVLAGDIGRGGDGVRWAREQAPEQLVFYVLGNHEFYRGCLEDVHARCEREAARAGNRMHVLRDSEHVVDGVAFLGATLWTDFSLFGEARRPEAIAAVCNVVPDYRVIRITAEDGAERALQPQDTMGAFARSLAWLQARVRYHREAGNKTCIISHHAPARGSLAERFENDLVSAYFVNTLDEWLRNEGPDLWLHGHTHDSFDYRIGPTRVVCNPRGYPGERAASDELAFDPALVIEV